MDSLDSILQRKEFEEPAEIAVIKRYVQDEFKSDVGVLVRDKDIVIQVPNAALANTLRLRTPDIKQLCKTTKRLTFRIG